MEASGQLASDAQRAMAGIGQPAMELQRAMEATWTVAKDMVATSQAVREMQQAVGARLARDFGSPEGFARYEDVLRLTVEAVAKGFRNVSGESGQVDLILLDGCAAG